MNMKVTYAWEKNERDISCFIYHKMRYGYFTLDHLTKLWDMWMFCYPSIHNYYEIYASLTLCQYFSIRFPIGDTLGINVMIGVNRNLRFTSHKIGSHWVSQKNWIHKKWKSNSIMQLLGNISKENWKNY